MTDKRELSPQPNNLHKVEKNGKYHPDHLSKNPTASLVYQKAPVMGADIFPVGAAARIKSNAAWRGAYLLMPRITRR
jgi:hypothetical protein